MTLSDLGDPCSHTRAVATVSAGGARRVGRCGETAGEPLAPPVSMRPDPVGFIDRRRLGGGGGGGGGWAGAGAAGVDHRVSRPATTRRSATVENNSRLLCESAEIKAAWHARKEE